MHDILKINQDNINKYTHSDQQGSYLDTDYAELARGAIPQQLRATATPRLTTALPATPQPDLDPELPTLIYNYYNLDPAWRKRQNANRVLLLEPALFEHYPVGRNGIGFMLDLAANIPGIQVFSGAFEQLLNVVGPAGVIYREHPLNRHYQGLEDAREWMFRVTGYYPSFFAFWKQCKKEIKGW